MLFRQILLNLVGNAIKFTSHGSINILIELERGSLNDAKLKFQITDTGCGLSSEQQARLFQPFSQGDSSVSRKFGGTGLGLVHSRRLANALGGDVVLTNSMVGRGSTFSFTLDPGPLNGVFMLKNLSAASLALPKPRISDWFESNQKLAGINVLLAEDSPDNQMLMMQFLVASGATVELALNGAEAVKMALAKKYSLILMDMQMPVLDGYSATTQLRSEGYDGPIVALTANAMLSERDKCFRAGCSEYLSKPIKANHLIDAVAKLAQR